MAGWKILEDQLNKATPTFSYRNGEYFKDGQPLDVLLELCELTGEVEGYERMKEGRPQVGVAIMIRRNGKILIHRRIGSHAYGKWACPGGHMEGGETFKQTALRELSEEVGDAIQVKNVQFWTVTNDRYWDENKHYVTVFMLADWVSGEAINMETTKGENWNWFDWEEIPKPRMIGLAQIMARGMNPFLSPAT